MDCIEKDFSHLGSNANVSSYSRNYMLYQKKGPDSEALLSVAGNRYSTTTKTHNMINTKSS